MTVGTVRERPRDTVAVQEVSRSNLSSHVVWLAAGLPPQEQLHCRAAHCKAVSVFRRTAPVSHSTAGFTSQSQLHCYIHPLSSCTAPHMQAAYPNALVIAAATKYKVKTRKVGLGCTST